MLQKDMSLTTNILFGNKTAALVLFYLQHHKSGHASEISRDLKIPLNMVQKQLAKFEQGNLLISYNKGKTKIFTWSKNWPGIKILLRFLKILAREQSIKNQTKNPADGSHLSLQERLKLAESLYQQAQDLNPYPKYKPFVKSFNTINEYEKWHKKQTNPWLV